MHRATVDPYIGIHASCVRAQTESHLCCPVHLNAEQSNVFRPTAAIAAAATVGRVAVARLGQVRCRVPGPHFAASALRHGASGLSGIQQVRGLIIYTMCGCGGRYYNK